MAITLGSALPRLQEPHRPVLHDPARRPRSARVCHAAVGLLGLRRRTRNGPPRSPSTCATSPPRRAATRPYPCPTRPCSGPVSPSPSAGEPSSSRRIRLRRSSWGMTACLRTAPCSGMSSRGRRQERRW
ncbi:hypothetical protein L209DRAFT_58304 [Thermothelomyces heterothallicus CBS 203.75]